MGKTYKDNPENKNANRHDLANKKGFFTRNFTQDMTKKGVKRAITETTEDTSAGESGLPSTH